MQKTLQPAQTPKGIHEYVQTGNADKEVALSAPSTAAIALRVQQGRVPKNVARSTFLRRTQRSGAEHPTELLAGTRWMGLARRSCKLLLRGEWSEQKGSRTRTSCCKFASENQNLIKMLSTGNFYQTCWSKVHSTLFSAAVVEAKCKCYIRCGHSDCSSTTGPQEWICKAECSDAWHT